MSVNYHVSTKTCELNNATHRWHNNEFKDENGYLYHGADVSSFLLTALLPLPSSPPPHHHHHHHHHHHRHHHHHQYYHHQHYHHYHHHHRQHHDRQNHFLLMYDALVAPYLFIYFFYYCSDVWGCMGKGLCDRLQRLQNRAGGIITFSDLNTRSADILQDLKWDTLEQRLSKQLAISVFKSLNKLYP